MRITFHNQGAMGRDYSSLELNDTEEQSANALAFRVGGRGASSANVALTFAQVMKLREKINDWLAGRVSNAPPLWDEE